MSAFNFINMTQEQWSFICYLWSCGIGKQQFIEEINHKYNREITELQYEAIQTLLDQEFLLS